MRNSGTEKKYKQRKQNNGTTPDRTKVKVNKEKNVCGGGGRFQGLTRVNMCTRNKN
jgi:hypothetical protein